MSKRSSAASIAPSDVQQVNDKKSSADVDLMLRAALYGVLFQAYADKVCLVHFPEIHI